MTFSLDLAGRAAFGLTGDYSIVVLKDPTKSDDANAANPTNEIVYDGSTTLLPIGVTIPDGLPEVQIYIRVYKSFQVIPKPDVVADLTLAPPVNGLLGPSLGTTNQTAAVTLKHPQLIVNQVTDTSVFDPVDNQYSLRGVIDALNAYAMQVDLGSPQSPSPQQRRFQLSSSSAVRPRPSH